jgi:hypothetical protein
MSFEWMVGEQVDQVDRAGITAFRDTTSLKPARQLILSSAGGASVRMGRHVAVSLLAAGLWLSMHGSAFAARLVRATVQLDGQTVLHSTYQDDDFWGAPPGAATVWRYLGKEPMWVENGVQFTADAAEPLRVKLKGDLVIRLQHRDLIGEAKASELTLIRADASSDKWFLPVDEVERIALANGIPNVPSSFWERTGVWLGVIVAAIVVVVSVNRQNFAQGPTAATR